MYSVDGQRFESDEPGLQPVLARAYQARNRPLCLCGVPPIPLYISCLDGTYVLKRMPCTGRHHAVDCAHYEAPNDLSGSIGIDAAISEDPDTGLTNLDVGFSLSRVTSRLGSNRSKSHVSTIHRTGSRLSLRGLLQFLWVEAELTRWKPAFAGKRTWAVVRHRLLRAAANKVLKGRPLSDVLIIPESFTVAEKEQIAARRSHRLADGLKRSGQSQGKMIVVGEMKEIVAARWQFSIIIKHLPDFAFSIDAAMHQHMIRNFEDELSLWGSAADVHLMIAATFNVSSRGQPLIRDLSLIPVSREWIPADDAFELRLVNCLVREGRSFRKSVCLNAKIPSLYPSAMLLEVKTAPIGLVLDRRSEDAADVDTTTASGSAPGWLWRVKEGDLPAFPQ